jgi:hypothetical protein
MTPSGNRRRPRSGTPLQPDLQEKAERIHAEIFGPGEQPEPSPPQRGGWVRYVAVFSLASAAWVLGERLNNYYLMMFALAVLGSSLGVFILRIIVSRKKR